MRILFYMMLLSTLMACGGGSVNQLDAGSDADLDAGADAGLDAGADASLDGGADAGLDAESDAGLDGADGGQVETGCWTEAPALSAVHFWVATDGDDEDDGSEQSPFASPQRAALAVRDHIANQGLPAGGLCVVFREGEYTLNATWTLSAEDSGQAGSLVTYRAYPGETVRITGSAPLEASWFETLSPSDPAWGRLGTAAATAVRVVDLSGHGITDYGTKQARGAHSWNASWSLELMIDDEIMELARWPNQGQTDPVDPEADALVAGDIFGGGTDFAYLGTEATGNADDGYANYMGSADGRSWYLYHCTWEWGGATHRYWWVSEIDPRDQANCWPSEIQAWGASGTDPLPVLSVLFGSAAEPLMARNRPEDYAKDGFLRIPEVESDTRFRLPGQRHEGWLDPATLWVQGLFYNYWADDSLPASLDASGWVDLPEEPAYGTRNLQPMAVFNVLEELDSPGEYFVDETRGLLFFWPPEDLGNARIRVSMLEAPILQIDGVSHVLFEGLVFSGSRQGLLRADDVAQLTFQRCRFLAASGDAITITGAQSGLNCCEVGQVGGQAIRLRGGHRGDLSHSENFVTHCDIHHFGIWDRTYHVGVKAEGCGHEVTHNRIHHAPHTAILFSGNDHLIRLNEIDHVVHESNDAGAIYSGRDWGYRGTLIEHNYFHDIDSVFGGAHGVYLDDAVSGMEVRGNIFSRIHGHATMSGGGRDNLVHHNVIVHIQRSAHYSDRRARTSNDTPGDSWNLIERLQRSNESYEWGSPLDHQAEPWASAYPLLALIPDDFTSVADSHWQDPEGCVFSGNLVWDTESFFTEGSWGGTGAQDFYVVEDNVQGEDPRFIDEADGDLNLAADSPALGIPGFVPIPFDQIGPQ